MVAASTLRTRSARGKRAAPTDSGDGANDSSTELDQLRARIAELEKSLPQQPAARAILRQERLPVGKPFKFDGARDDQKVRLWLSEIDTLLKAQAHLVGALKLGEDDKLTIAESYLEDTARRQYNVKVTKNGQFGTYDLFKKWMLDFYAPPRRYPSAS